MPAAITTQGKRQTLKRRSEAHCQHLESAVLSHPLHPFTHFAPFHTFRPPTHPGLASPPPGRCYFSCHKRSPGDVLARDGAYAAFPGCGQCPRATLGPGAYLRILILHNHGWSCRPIRHGEVRVGEAELRVMLGPRAKLQSAITCLARTVLQSILGSHRDRIWTPRIIAFLIGKFGIWRKSGWCASPKMR